MPALYPIAGRPIAGAPFLSGATPPVIQISSGFFWPTIFPQAARAKSIALDSVGRIILGSMAEFISASGSGSAMGFLMASGGSAGWSLGPSLSESPSLPYAISQGLLGYPNAFPQIALDPYGGPLPWGGATPAFPTATGAPWIGVVPTTYGAFLATESSIVSMAGATIVTGASGAISALGSGSHIYMLASGTVYDVSLSSPTSGSMSGIPLPFTATAMGTSGSGLAIGGYVSGILVSGAYAIAPQPSNSGFLALTNSSAIAWILSGAPASWQPFATTTGMSFSSGLGASFVPAGNQVLVSDSGSGIWSAFSYTGGALSLLVSGSESAILPMVAPNGDSSAALIPNPTASGFFALVATGATWQASGVSVTGVPGAATVNYISGDSWGVGWAGHAGIATLSSGTWSLAQSVALPWNPALGIWDPRAQNLWLMASGGQAAAIRWSMGSGSISLSGSWSPSGVTGMPSGLLYQGQLVIASDSPAALTTAGQSGPGAISTVSGISLSHAPTSIAGPFSDGTVMVGLGSSGISLLNFDSPFTLTRRQFGVWTIMTGDSLGATASLGYLQVPSAIGIGTSGEPWLATTAGYLGGLSGVPGTLASSLVSGGYSAGMVASGMSILTTTVQGLIYIVSGII